MSNTFSKRISDEILDGFQKGQKTAYYRGVASIVALIISRFRNSLIKSMSLVALIISLASFGLVARTSYLGDRLRPTEIANGAIQSSGGSEEGEKEND